MNLQEQLIANLYIKYFSQCCRSSFVEFCTDFRIGFSL